MKRVLVLLVLIAASCRKHETAVPEVVGTPPQMPMQMSSSTEPVPDRNAPVLTAAQLTNPAAASVYAEAAQITDRLSKMYCYCQCHEQEGHVSLLTCFQTKHAEECGICLREADQAYRDWKDGKPVHASQHAADVAFHRGSPPPSLPE
ncbi:MAG: PCYCGC motif-containing (lipo)protein [Thermoanaerobaculia bacterium]